jgi:ATP-dependent helicase HrpB
MKTPLPIDEYLPEIERLAKSNSNLIIEATPGAGKTTRVPPALLGLTEKKILVLEPRRLAAVASALRVAEEQNYKLGIEVGYQVRFESVGNDSTRLLYLTEALLIRKLLSDPLLDEVGIVVLDEFHERSLATDLSLGLLFELQQLSRPDLKMVVMSATLEGGKLAQFLPGSVRVQVQGKVFPLEQRPIKASQLLKFNPDLTDRILNELKSVRDRKGILVFLPGVGEIQILERKILESEHFKDFALFKLHGSLSLQEQKEVLSPSSQKKIILATNIAESALTVPGVDTVLDTGLAKAVKLNPTTGAQRLTLGRISKASAQQRAGRAARQTAGVVIQLWNRLDENSMPDFEVAQVHREDLCESLLFLAAMGLQNFDSFSWFEKPPQPALDLAQSQLQQWNLLTQENQITEIGRASIRFPVHPRLGRVLIEGQKKNSWLLACELVVLLSERYPTENAPASLRDRLEAFRQQKQDRRFSSHRKALQQILKVHSPSKSESEVLIPELLLPSFKDRLCRLRKPGSKEAQIFYGKGVSLSDRLTLPPDLSYFFAMDLIETDSQQTLVSSYLAVDEKWLFERLKTELKTEIQFEVDPNSKKLWKYETQKLGSWKFGEAKMIPVQPLDLQNEWPSRLVPYWDLILNSNEKLKDLLSRLKWFRAIENMPEIQMRALPLLEGVCLSATSFEEILNADFEPLISMQIQNLDPEFDWFRFQRDCPATFEAPTSRSFAIKYSEGKDPEIEIRLQELFGTQDTPKIRQGKTSLRLHLLGPNYRPVQVTQDLASFWKNTYPEVRTELRLKYPKHSWPEDPRQAPPVARGSHIKR